MGTKEDILKEARTNVKHAREAITSEMHATEATIVRYKPLKADQLDPLVKARLLAHFDERLDQLHHLFPSPFFFRGDIIAENGQAQTLYFGKFPLIEKNIFSWTSPAARIRFADLGNISYALPEQGTWKGGLIRKDQFMISGGEIRFMTTENIGGGRTLVYQEQLSRRKTDFMLPEIVARMERAQDDVIRADWKGSFLISGPAGSGKTTLAFHRIAFLLQSPETTQHFSDENIIVFVQDESTKAYFSRLLPELGIHNVTVTTFAAWAFEQLGIKNGNFVRRQNGNNTEMDELEYQKLHNLRSRTLEKPSHTTYDRFDLTALLLKKGVLKKEEEYFIRKKEFEVTRKKRIIPLKYSLIVVDEVQNYLPEQISILRSCISEETGAMLYVGDLRQQVMLGTLKNWEDVGEAFSTGRKVELDKVYRSTKQILRYIASLAYPVEIPDELREGMEVSEEIHQDAASEIERIKKLSKENDNRLQTGVIGFSEEYLAPFKEQLANIPNIHVLTVGQAQGVEFDRVFLVGVNKDLFTVSVNNNQAYLDEIAIIRKDLVYVALTRAIDELFVFGKESLQKVTKSIS